MKLFISLLLFFPLTVLSQQQNSGIDFKEGLSWKQILLKAKQENKYIFVDCAASWCLPCKKMEKEVFNLENVGSYMNANFISVHAQLDTSKNDNEIIKNWYSDAHNLKEQYNVTAFPTYLFFSPDGKIIHRYLYAIPDSLFLKVAENALDPNKQYYTLLNKYLKGQKDYDKLIYLATISKFIDDKNTAKLIATDYLHNHLNKLEEAAFFQRKNIDFIDNFPDLLTSKDRAFLLLYKKQSQADNLISKKGFSKNLIFSIVTKEELTPRLWQNKVPVSNSPDWNQLMSVVEKKYNKDLAERVVLDAQISWYYKMKDKKQLIKYSIKKIDDYGLDTAGLGWVAVNNLAYDLVFKYCNNKDTLNKVIGWMEIINANHPDDQINMDTYANLLYKAGRTEEAITWEEKASDLEDKAAQRENREADKSFREALDKMKKGIPTWVVK